MSSSFDADEVSRVSNDPFGENGYTGSDPQSPSHGYASYAAFSADEDDKDPIHISADASGFVAFVHEDISPTPEGYGYLSDTHLGFDSAASPFSMQNSNGSAYDEQMNAVEYLSDGPILQSPDEMHSDQGFFRREWRRQNSIVLEEKERVEKELRSEIILEAEEYKKSYHEKRKLTCQTNRAQNREKEKVLLANHEKFHANADKHYWKAIADLIPNEVPNMEKRTKKEQLNQLQDKKKPSITIHQGPKPGKPTDLSRLRHLLMKLKHDAPPHLAAFTPASTNPAPASPNPAPESSDVAAAPSKVTVAG